MQIIHIKSKIGSDRCLRLNVPVEFSAGDDVEAVLVISSSNKEKSYDFSDFIGKLKWEGDSVKTQRKIRDEW